MAIGVHVVNVYRGFIIPDATVSNSAGGPDVKTYIEAEAADGYVVNQRHHSQSDATETMVSYSAADVNAA